MDLIAYPLILCLSLLTGACSPYTYTSATVLYRPLVAPSPIPMINNRVRLVDAHGTTRIVVTGTSTSVSSRSSNVR
jgi:hypothetical protein